MLTDSMEQLFMMLAIDHKIKTYQQLFCCVKVGTHDQMIRRVISLARRTEQRLRDDNSMWCIAATTLGFVMHRRANVARGNLADAQSTDEIFNRQNKTKRVEYQRPRSDPARARSREWYRKQAKKENGEATSNNA